MQSWEYEIGDVLLIQRGPEIVARVAGYVDQMDNTKPLYCNLRANGNAWWRKSIIKVQPIQIIKLLPTWEADHEAEVIAKHKAHIQDVVDRKFGKMTPEQQQRVASLARRSPLDIMIDRACGIE